MFKAALLLILISSAACMAQIAVGVQAGYAHPAFEKHDAASGAIPIGIQVGTNFLPVIEVGGEFSMTVKPFVMEEEGATDDFEVTQTFVGVYGKYFLPMPAFTPYARAGVGYYLGGWEQGNADGDFDGAIGFNVGAGVNTMMGIYGEFVYHIVSRKGDWEGAKSYGYNNWGIHAGYRIDL